MTPRPAGTGDGDGSPEPGAVLLAALRWTWDGTYLITGNGDGSLTVTRADNGGTFTAADPLAARDAIIADYARKPSWPPRDVGALDRRMAFERAHPGARWLPPSTMHRVVWPDGDGKWHEEASPTVDGLLGRLRSRGLEWGPSC